MYSKITVILYIISSIFQFVIYLKDLDMICFTLLIFLNLVFLLAKEISTLKCFTCVGCESGDILSNITCGNRIGNETTAAPTNENITINWSCYVSLLINVLIAKNIMN